MARLFFCFIPALLIALVVALINPAVGVFAFMAAFGLGWQITETKPERGERNGR